MKDFENSQFWRHFEKWRPLFNNPRYIAWNENWLENHWCGDCGYCCGPQGDDEPFPMALLPEQTGLDNKNDFYMLNENTAYIGSEGCKSGSETGCRLSREKKPIACGLFPLVLANGRLYLYQGCPASLGIPLAFFEKVAIKAAAMLNEFSEKELRHISINLPCETLSSKYIDLHISLFDDSGKDLRFD